MKLKDHNPTTRRYPNTLGEAFPNSVEQSQWWYPPEKNRTLGNIVLFIIGIALWVGLAYLLARD